MTFTLTTLHFFFILPLKIFVTDIIFTKICFYYQCLFTKKERWQTIRELPSRNWATAHTALTFLELIRFGTNKGYPSIRYYVIIKSAHYRCRVCINTSSHLPKKCVQYFFYSRKEKNLIFFLT